jgi:hypothetical protein
MKKALFLLLAATLIISCKQKDEKQTVDEKIVPEVKTDSLLITDTSWGLITEKTNFEALQKLYGINNIKDERMCGPECIDSIDVTILYPGAKNETIIYWQDSMYHKSIGMIRCYSDSAGYHTSTGIKIGSGISNLLKLNGQKINFYGFGWDYGGGIISYNNGKLEKSPIQFELDLLYDESDAYNKLLGDIELNTEMPLVKKALDKIKIRLITLSFYKRE